MEMRLPANLISTTFAGAILSILTGGVAAQAQQFWNTAGNPGTNPTTNFVGTTDGRPLVIQRGTGNVGIGTTNPGQKLDIEGPMISANGASAFEVAPDVGGSTSLWTNATYNRGSPFSGWVRTLNMKGGNVGVGTVSPDAKLHVSSGDVSSPQSEITQTTPFDFARLRFASFGTDPDNPSQPRPFPFWDVAAGTGVLNLFVQTTGNVMTLTSNGRVGIRTEQPTSELHVNGTATVRVLQITGGADLSEHFEVRGGAHVGSLSPPPIQAGLVVSIDPDEPGKLVISRQAYDRKVAGIISGAGGVRPGMLMTQSGSMADGDHPVALTGRVYCWADASSGPIAPGDLLTTSDTPGHAMKVTNYAKARGAVLGKAMTALKQGKGLVLALVTLQ
jgi:hypothetical protein